MERFIRHIEGIDVIDSKELFSPDAWKWERETDRRGQAERDRIRAEIEALCATPGDGS